MSGQKLKNFQTSNDENEIENSLNDVTEHLSQSNDILSKEFNKTKRTLPLLQKIDENITSISELAKKLKIKAPTVYVHMKELRDDGFLNKENKLTEIGRIILLNN